VAQADIPETTTEWTGNKHRQQIVQRMLDYIHEHYSRPMQLGDVATAMNMNAAYVSSLFHTATGATFHHYLEELRLTKSKDLLRDPVKRVCEVACAVGYTNPNHFRDVFKTRIGISPSVWRDRPEP
jgi:two-component system response regulator YesN